MWTGNLDLLGYVLDQHSQELADSDLMFKFNPGMGHVEFYIFGELLAIPIYSNPTKNRLELLVVSLENTPEEIATSVREMIQMIKRKQRGPITRRIKLDS